MGSTDSSTINSGSKGSTCSIQKTAKFTVIDAPGVSQPDIVVGSETGNKKAKDVKSSNVKETSTSKPTTQQKLAKDQESQNGNPNPNGEKKLSKNALKKLAKGKGKKKEKPQWGEKKKKKKKNPKGGKKKKKKKKKS